MKKLSRLMIVLIITLVAGVNISLCFDQKSTGHFTLNKLEALADMPAYEDDNPDTWFRMATYMCRYPYNSDWEKVCESSGIRMDCDERDQQSCPDGRSGLGNQN